MARAATYLRISSDRSGEGLGVERQREACEALIARRDWTLVKTYTENDTSAAGRKPRPEFRALLAAVRSRDVDIIVAWSFDRLARTARDRLDLVEACRAAEVMIALVRGSDMDPTTPGGRLAIGMLGEVAQHEIDQKSDRQKAAALQAAEAGKWIGGRRAFGFDADGMTQRPLEAAAIRDAYTAILAGESLRGVAAAWNAAGMTTGQSPWKNTDRSKDGFSLWRADSVRRVLLNPRYAGLRAHNGEIVGRAQWRPVVDEATWRAARSWLEDESRRKAKLGLPKHLLTGIAECAACGLAVHGGGARHKKPVYRCRSTHLLPDQKPSVVATHVNRLAHPVDEYVTEVVIARLSRPDARELMVEEEAAPDLVGLQNEAVHLRSRLEELAAEFGAGAEDPLPPREYRAMRAPLVTKLEDIEVQITEAGKVSILHGLAGEDDVAAAWEQIGLDRRRAVLDLLMTVRLHAVGRGTRTFRPETIEIEWR